MTIRLTLTLSPERGEGIWTLCPLAPERGRGLG
jgi:hypothetical protein